MRTVETQCSSAKNQSVHDHPAGTSLTFIMAVSLLEIITKYGVLISEWGGLYYALLEVSMNKIAL